MDPITSTISPALTAYTLATVPPIPNDITRQIFSPVPAPDRLINIRVATSPPIIRNGSRPYGAPITFSGVSGQLTPVRLDTTSIGKTVDKRQIGVIQANQIIDPISQAARLAKIEATASDTYYNRAVPLQDLTPGNTYGTVMSVAGTPWDTDGTAKSTITEACRIVRDYCGVDQMGLSVALFGTALDALRNDPLFIEQRSRTVFNAAAPKLQDMADYLGVQEVISGFGSVTLEGGARVPLYPVNSTLIYYAGDPARRVDPEQGDLLFAALYELFQNALVPWFDNDTQSWKTAWEIENLSVIHHPGSAALLTGVHS